MSTRIRIDLRGETPAITPIACNVTPFDACAHEERGVANYGFAADHDPQESFSTAYQMTVALQTLCTNMQAFCCGVTREELASGVQSLLDTYGQNETFDENVRRIGALAAVFTKDNMDYVSHYYGGLKISGPELSRWILAAAVNRAERDRGRINSTNHVLSDIADVIERACKLPVR